MTAFHCKQKRQEKVKRYPVRKTINYNRLVFLVPMKGHRQGSECLSRHLIPAMLVDYSKCLPEMQLHEEAFAALFQLTSWCLVLV